MFGGEGYLWLQQSPGQHEAPGRQQLADAPQQLPGQHCAFFAQQAAPVKARADMDNRDIDSRVNSLDFMIGFLSV